MAIASFLNMKQVFVFQTKTARQIIRKLCLSITSFFTIRYFSAGKPICALTFYADMFWYLCVWCLYTTKKHSMITYYACFFFKVYVHSLINEIRSQNRYYYHNGEIFKIGIWENSLKNCLSYFHLYFHEIIVFFIEITRKFGLRK